jgi:hypothetical protein
MGERIGMWKEKKIGGQKDETGTRENEKMMR